MRQITAARRPRSAALFVGSTSVVSANVHSAGQSLSRFFASARTCRGRLPVEPRSSNGRICALIAASRCWSAIAVAVLLELLPGVEDVPRHLETVEPERLLRAKAEVGVEG